MKLSIISLLTLLVLAYFIVKFRKTPEKDLAELLDKQEEKSPKAKPLLTGKTKEAKKTLRIIGLGLAVAGLLCLSQGMPLVAFAPLLAGYLLYSKNKDEDFSVDDKTIYTFLPLTLQKLIMLVEAGNDLMQALKKLTSQHEENNKILKIFREIVEKFESGLTVEQSIQLVKNKYQNLTLNFVLTYLNISLKEGGQITPQLQELSNTVLQSYEAFIETEVNKMPVKALAPLMVMFAGVFLILAALPAAQIVEYLKQVEFDKTLPF